MPGRDPNAQSRWPDLEPQRRFERDRLSVEPGGHGFAGGQLE
jgi:hypothetical protein